MNKQSAPSSKDIKNKLDEIEDIIQAKREQQELEEQAVMTIVDYIEDKIYPFTISKNGTKNVKILCDSFEYKDIIDAIDIAEDKYFKYDSDDKLTKDSVETFFNKLGGILHLKNSPPIEQKIAYVKGICRNRFSYWREYRGKEILNDYIEALETAGYDDEMILRDFDDDVIPKAKKCENWSQWKNLMEGWTDDLRRRGQEDETSCFNPKIRNLQPTNKEQYPESDVYLEEKRKGGANSYQAYKPLKNKVEELCLSELARCKYSSASQLCNKVAEIVETEFSDLLNVFQPYQTHKKEGNDWKRPTFYGWCNSIYKAHKSHV